MRCNHLTSYLFDTRIPNICTGSGALLSRNQAACLLRVSPGTLAVWDYRQCYDLLPIRIKSRVYYRKNDLIRYLEDRGITKAIAEKYLKEITLYNTATQKEFFAAAIKNEDGGYDYRNLYFKGCVKKKAITFVRGAIPGNGGIHVFEGFIDFLSVITSRQGMPFYDDAVILNSVSCLKEATAYMRGYDYRVAYTWLDNDEAGKKATTAFDTFFLCKSCANKKALTSFIS